MIIHNGIPIVPGEKIPGYEEFQCSCGEFFLVPLVSGDDHFVECTHCRSQYPLVPKLPPPAGRKKTDDEGKIDGKSKWRIFRWLQMFKDKLKQMRSTTNS